MNNSLFFQISTKGCPKGQVQTFQHPLLKIYLFVLQVSFKQLMQSFISIPYLTLIICLTGH